MLLLCVCLQRNWFLTASLERLCFLYSGSWSHHFSLNSVSAYLLTQLYWQWLQLKNFHPWATWWATGAAASFSRTTWAWRTERADRTRPPCPPPPPPRTGAGRPGHCRPRTGWCASFCSTFHWFSVSLASRVGVRPNSSGRLPLPLPKVWAT